MLSKGLKFGILQRTVKEEIQAEFEVAYQQLREHEPSSKEAAEALRSKMARIAESFHSSKGSIEGFSLESEHFAAIKSLRNNDRIVITRPDKGQGVVLMEKTDYIAKMTAIRQDRTKS